MIRNDHPFGARQCESCGKPVNLNRHGQYRRHYTSDANGRHLCRASGRTPAGVVQLLTVEPTPEERRSHALRLLGS